MILFVLHSLSETLQKDKKEKGKKEEDRFELKIW